MASKRHRAFASVFLGLTVLARALHAQAQTLRLQGDALAAATAPAPAGLVVLQGEDARRPWLGIEGLVWAGARNDASADVLTLSARLRAPRGLGELRVGRFLLATGAVRPVQLDGALALARAPGGTSLEVFGGTPAVPRLGDRPYDGLAGARLAQAVRGRGTLGVSYVTRRTRGEVDDDEAGADFAFVPARWCDVAARGAYDLASPGIAEALFSAAARSGPVRLEAFGSHRSPGRLLPATSLFTVLGDFPSQALGATARWEAAPRLDLLGSGSGRFVGGQPGADAWLRALLRLDDRGDGALGLELRRVAVPGARWIGVRATGSHPLGRGFRFSSEIEVAVPDAPRGRGVAWPWGLLALAWRPGNGWEAAGALEAGASPEQRYAVNTLLRLSRTLEVP